MTSVFKSVYGLLVGDGRVVFCIRVRRESLASVDVMAARLGVSRSEVGRRAFAEGMRVLQEPPRPASAEKRHEPEPRQPYSGRFGGRRP